jgi:hypothetical protein
MKQMGSERALFRLSESLVVKMSKRERVRRGMEVFIPPLPETSRWESGTRKLRVYVRILRT